MAVSATAHHQRRHRQRRRPPSPASTDAAGDVGPLPEAAGRADAEPGSAQPDGQRAGDEPDGADQHRHRHRQAQRDGARPVRPVHAAAGGAGRVAGRPRRDRAGQQARIDRRSAVGQGGFELDRRRRRGQGRDPRAERRRSCDTLNLGAAERRPAQLRLAGRQRRRRRAACTFRVTATSGATRDRRDHADARHGRRGHARAATRFNLELDELGHASRTAPIKAFN